MIQMLKEYEILDTISITAMYCSIYNVPISDILLPPIKDKVLGVKLLSMLQGIQYRWLEEVTGLPWTTQGFIDICESISDWIEKLPQDSNLNQSQFEYWWATEWKRGAEQILGLNIKGDSQ